MMAREHMPRIRLKGSGILLRLARAKHCDLTEIIFCHVSVPSRGNFDENLIDATPHGRRGITGRPSHGLGIDPRGFQAEIPTDYSKSAGETPPTHSLSHAMGMEN
jgi:hypothetical protein